MPILLLFDQLVVGEIYPTKYSDITSEFAGLLIPNKEYFKRLALVKKYNEIFNSDQSNSIVDRFLNKLLRKKYAYIQDDIKRFSIYAEDALLSDSDTLINLPSSFIRTGYGNEVAEISAYGMKRRESNLLIPIYNLEYPYPSSHTGLISISMNGRLVREC